MKNRQDIFIIAVTICSLILCASSDGDRGEPFKESTLAEEVAKKIKEALPDLLSGASVPDAAVAVVDDRDII